MQMPTSTTSIDVSLVTSEPIPLINVPPVVPVVPAVIALVVFHAYFIRINGY